MCCTCSDLVGCFYLFHLPNEPVICAPKWAKLPLCSVKEIGNFGDFSDMLNMVLVVSSMRYGAATWHELINVMLLVAACRCTQLLEFMWYFICCRHGHVPVVVSASVDRSNTQSLVVPSCTDGICRGRTMYIYWYVACSPVLHLHMY